MAYDGYVNAVVGKSVAHMLKEIGFQAVETCAHRTLASVLERYVQEMGASMAQAAGLAGRTVANENDFRAAVAEFDREGETDRDVVRSLVLWKQSVLDPHAPTRDVPAVPPFATRPKSEPIGLRALYDATPSPRPALASPTPDSVAPETKCDPVESHIPHHLPPPPASTPVYGKRPRVSVEVAFQKKFKEQRGVETALVHVQRALKQASVITVD